MPVDLTEKLVIAISSRALFDLDDSHKVFEKEGLEAYARYQIDNENKVLAPGFAFSLVKKLLNIKDPKTQERLVEVILLSRNSADTGLRIFNSISHHNLPITRAAFTNGENTDPYVTAFDAHLFLSANSDDVKKTLQSGFAAATIFSGQTTQNDSPQVRIAFDGDSVLFSDEAECVFQKEGLDVFSSSEAKQAKKTFKRWPLKKLSQRVTHHTK